MRKRPPPTKGGHRPPPNSDNRAPDTFETAENELSPFAEMNLTPTQRKFLGVFSVVGRIDRATEIAEVGKWSHAGWMKQRRYKEAYQLARRMAADTIESEAIRRAVDGVKRMRFYQGRPIMVPLLDDDGRPVRDDETGAIVMEPYIEYEYSDALLIILLKALLPKRYGDRRNVKVSVNSPYRVAGRTPDECRADVLKRLQQLAGVRSNSEQ